MTTKIKKWEEISSLKEINGIDLNELNRRCRPIQDNSSDPQWRFRSFEGFISNEEDIQGVISKDWKMVQDIGTNHFEIYEILNEIIKETEIKRKKENFGPMKSILLSFPTKSFPQFFENDSNHSIKQKNQSLLIHRQIFNGDQYSPFWNESISKIEEEKEEEEENLNVKWREEFIIQHVSLGIKIKVAVGILKFIKQLGFYEGGGNRNPYRINPILVAAIASGRSNVKVLKECEEQWEETWRADEEECCLLRGELSNQKDKDALKWIEERISHLGKVIQDKKQEAQVALQLIKEKINSP